MIRNLMEKCILAAVFILLVCCPAVYAETDDDSDLSMMVPDVRLVVVEPDILEFGPTLRDMVGGWTETMQITAIVSANTDWVLTIKGSSEFWEGPYQKPVSDIYWGVPGREYLPLSTLYGVVVSGGLSNQRRYPINIKVKLDMSRDPAGEYLYYNMILELMAP